MAFIVFLYNCTVLNDSNSVSWCYNKLGKVPIWTYSISPFDTKISFKNPEDYRYFCLIHDVQK